MLENTVWEREQPVRCCLVSKKREQPVSDHARQVHVQDQEAILPGRCMFRIKTGAHQ
jgi:hypothetical protein